MLDCRIPLQHFGHSSVTTYRDLCEIYRVRGDAGLPAVEILVEQKMVIVSGNPGEGLDLIVRCEKGRIAPRYAYYVNNPDQRTVRQLRLPVHALLRLSVTARTLLDAFCCCRLW